MGRIADGMRLREEGWAKASLLDSGEETTANREMAIERPHERVQGFPLGTRAAAYGIRAKET